MTETDSIYKIYMSIRGRLARAVMGIVPPKEVEDIVQETYVRVCQVEKNGHIRTPQSFLFKTARNLALDHVKSAEYRLSVSSDSVDDGKSLGTDKDSDETFSHVASDEEFASFCEAVRHLPIQCRRAFVLRKVYGFSQREIAEEMGVSENTVEKHIAKGIRRCSEFMRQYEGTKGKTMSKRLTDLRGRETDQ